MSDAGRMPNHPDDVKDGGMVHRLVNIFKKKPKSDSYESLQRASSVLTHPDSVGGDIPDDVELDAMFDQVMVDTVQDSKLRAELVRTRSREVKWAMVRSSGRQAEFQKGRHAPAHFLEGLQKRTSPPAFLDHELVGLGEVSSNQDLLNSLGLFTTIKDPTLRLIPFHIFTVAAYANPPDAVHLILNAMSFLQRTLEDENRFDRFLKMMAKACQNITTDESGMSLVIDGLIFINAILDNLEDTEIRIHIRNQIYCRPFRSEFVALRQVRDPRIARQLDVFTALLQADAEWAMSQYNRPARTMLSTKDLFDLLLEELADQEGVVVVTRLLQHILSIRTDSSVRIRYIRLLDKTLEQILLTGKGIDPDFNASPLPCFTVKDLEIILNTKELDALKQENMRLKFELTSLNDQKSHLAKTFKGNNEILTEQCSELKRQLEVATNKALEDQKSMRFDSDTRVARLTTELEDTQRKLADLESTSKNLKVNMAELETSKVKSEEHIKQLEDQNRRLESQTKELEIQINGMKAASSPTFTSINTNVASPNEPTSPSVSGKRHSMPPNLVGNVPPPPPMPARAQSISLGPALPKVPPPPPRMPIKVTSPAEGLTSDHNTTQTERPTPALPVTKDIKLLAAYPSPSRRLKTMQWRPIPPIQIPSSVFEKANMSDFEGKVDFSRIDHLFEVSKEEVSKEEGNKDEERNDANRPDAVMAFAFLTHAKRLPLSITVKSVRVDENVLLNALQKLDDKIFDYNLSTNFQNCFFDKKGQMMPIGALKAMIAFNGDTTGIVDPIEKLSTVRGFPIRIRFMLERAQTLDLIRVCNTLLDPYFDYFARMRRSERLRKIIWLVLYIGNYVNQGGNARLRNAMGFSVEYIASLRPLRGCLGDSNMMTYLVGLVKDEFPDLTEVIDELSFMKNAKEMKIKDIQDVLGKLADAKDAAEYLVSMYELFDPPQQGDDFMKVLKGNRSICFQLTPHLDYFRHVEESRVAITTRFSQLQVELQSIFAYFFHKEIIKEMTAEMFFSIFNDFLSDFENSKILMEKKELEIQREKRLQDAKNRDGRSKVAGMLVDKSDKRGVMDSLLDTLRTGRRSASISNHSQ